MAKVNKTISLDAETAAIADNMENFSEFIRKVLKAQDGHGNCSSCGINSHHHEAVRKQAKRYSELIDEAYDTHSAIFKEMGSVFELVWIRNL
jgi:predicted ATPase